MEVFILAPELGSYTKGRDWCIASWLRRASQLRIAPTGRDANGLPRSGQSPFPSTGCGIRLRFDPLDTPEPRLYHPPSSAQEIHGEPARQRNLDARCQTT